MAKPVCSQMTITIRNRLFQGAIATHLSQACGCTAQGNNNGIQYADLGCI